MKKVFIYSLLVLTIISLSLFSCKQKTKKIDYKEIHNSVLTVDTHTDTPMRIMDENFDISIKHKTGEKNSGKVDLPRMKEGGLDCIFFAVFQSQRGLTENGRKNAYDSALKTVNKIHEVIEANNKIAEIALNPEDGYKIEKNEKRAIYIGMENGYPIGLDLKKVEFFYNLGVRYITLCHTSNNDICDSSTDDEPLHNGLSDFGKKVVVEMNKLGMIVDVSHASDKTVLDVLEISKAPIIASHSCAKAICDSKRNLNDNLIRRIAENKGVIQVTLLPSYVKNYPKNEKRSKAISKLRKRYKGKDNITKEEREQISKEWHSIMEKYPFDEPTVSELIDHIDHIVKLVGIDYVGIGSDFDGGGSLSDCKDVSQYPNITKELVKRGYTKEDIRKIWGGNFMRVFKEIQKVSTKI